MMTSLLLSPELWAAMLRGLQITLLITVVSISAGLVLGIGLALVRVFGGSVGRFLAATYIFLFRGIPLLILLYILYYGVPQIALLRSGPLWNFVFSSALATCLLAFMLNNAAYLAEVVRGGILSVKRGEIEAGHALGLTRSHVILRIVLPLALRNCLSGIANEAIFTIKASAIASVITVRDLLGEAQRFGTTYADNVTPLVAAGLLYILAVQLVEWGTRVLSARLHGDASPDRGTKLAAASKNGS